MGLEMALEKVSELESEQEKEMVLELVLEKVMAVEFDEELEIRGLLLVEMRVWFESELELELELELQLLHCLNFHHTQPFHCNCTMNRYLHHCRSHSHSLVPLRHS